MEQYTLFLDESEIPVVNEHDKEINRLFVIGGIIVENKYHDTILTDKLNEIKDKIWNKDSLKDKRHSYVLHELEVTEAHYGRFRAIKHKYHRIFAKPTKYTLLYDEMSLLFSNTNIITISACIKKTELHDLYNKDSLNDYKSILMQIIIENYYHFLIENDGIGSICYESMPESQNDIIRKRYNYTKNTGTMFYHAKGINKRITGIEFIDKEDNITGLQLADFVPNTLGRPECDKDSNSDKNYESVYNKLYDGNRNLQKKFGLKIIP